MIKRFEPLPVPRGPVQENDLLGVVEVGGHPYAIFLQVDHDLRNNRMRTVHLVPFVEEKKP